MNSTIIRFIYRNPLDLEPITGQGIGQRILSTRIDLTLLVSTILQGANSRPECRICHDNKYGSLLRNKLWKK